MGKILKISVLHLSLLFSLYPLLLNAQNNCNIWTRAEYRSGRYYAKFRKDCNRAVTIYYKAVFADGSADNNGMEYMSSSISETTGRSYPEDFRIVITKADWENSDNNPSVGNDAGNGGKDYGKKWIRKRYGEDIYEGEMINGERNGYGKYVWGDDGMTYEGHWTNGKMDGEGKVTWNDGSTYEGDFVRGVRTGHGKYIGSDGEKYEGEWRDNKREGYGKAVYKNGNSYEGYFSNGLRNGDGTYYWSDGYYKGQWKNNMRDGSGFMKYGDNLTYEGDWAKDVREGYGVLIWPNGARYEGEYRNNGRTGKGTMIIGKGDDYIKNCPGCVKYSGEWLSGSKNGYGICYDANGKILYEGIFKDDKPVAKGEF
jgi:hypothetical protein